MTRRDIYLLDEEASGVEASIGHGIENEDLILIIPLIHDPLADAKEVHEEYGLPLAQLEDFKNLFLVAFFKSNSVIAE